ncbi:MAG: glycosyltransferase [Bacteroidia bacterium]|nr:glycosyltransferase [Bacteroidia bacterium]MDW8133620.1 glycosyltransferase [Bacteroidia bacterium]
MLPVSVIIPAYNEASNLGRLLESLLSQSPPPGEIIVVDAGSTDETPTIAESYGVRVLRVNKAYPGQARNIGIAHASYDIVACWDGSMWLAPSCLFYLLEPILRGEADISQGHLEIEPLTKASILQFTILQPPYTDRLPTGHFLYCHPVACVAFRKVLWQQVGGFRPWRAREDSDFRKRIESTGARVALCPKAVSYWNPAESFESLYRKVRLYGRHNLLSGNPWEWYGGILRVYISYLAAGLLFYLWKGSLVALGILGVIMGGGLMRTARKIYLYYPYWKMKHRLGFCNILPLLFGGTILLLATDFASLQGVVDWLLKDKLRLDPETFPEPVIVA